MMVKKGSGILCILITMASIFMVMSLVIRYTSYGIDIAHQHLLHEQRSFALKGLLNYGITLAQQEQIPETPLHIAPWLKEYSGTLTFSENTTAVTIEATLYITPKNFVTMSSIVLKSSAVS